MKTYSVPIDDASFFTRITIVFGNRHTDCGITNVNFTIFNGADDRIYIRFGSGMIVIGLKSYITHKTLVSDILCILHDWVYLEILL